MKKPNHGLIYVLLFSLFWAINVLIDKIVYSRGAVPYVWAYQSLLFSALFLGIYVFLRDSSRRKSLRLHHNDWSYLLLLGIISNGIGALFGTVGLKLSYASNYGFLIKTTVVFVTIFSYFLLKQKITGKKMFFILLLLLGSYLISTKGETFAPQIGDLLILVSAACFGITAVLSEKIGNRNSPEYFSFFRGLGGGIFVLLAAILLRYDILNTEFLGLAILNGFVVFLLFLFFYLTIEARSASYMTMVSMVFSVFVAALSFIFLKEAMNAVQIIGGGIIIAAVVMIEKLKV
ncbi:MAG: DMT family transporter [Nanoarchaeota archaeon]|nr:DMT family transporter [Nanoarchaeota archaeon]